MIFHRQVPTAGAPAECALLGMKILSRRPPVGGGGNSYQDALLTGPLPRATFSEDPPLYVFLLGDIFPDGSLSEAPLLGSIPGAIYQDEPQP